MEGAQAILGERGLTRDAELMEPWLTDWRGRYRGKAIALASPANTAEVAALVALATTATPVTSSFFVAPSSRHTTSLVASLRHLGEVSAVLRTARGSR